jgi:hypothetical protein
MCFVTHISGVPTPQNSTDKKYLILGGVGANAKGVANRTDGDKLSLMLRLLSVAFCIFFFFFFFFNLKEKVTPSLVPTCKLHDFHYVRYSPIDIYSCHFKNKDRRIEGKNNSIFFT